MKTPTDEHLNLAMCEWMGWTFDPSCGPLGAPWRKPNTPAWDGDSWSGRAEALPNYLSDDSPRRLLNEAEARLTDVQFIRFAATLNGLWLADNPQPANKMGLLRTVSATARQRTIAILQTIKPELFQ